MPSLLSALPRYSSATESHAPLALIVTTLLASIVSNLWTPTQHSLLTSASAWVGICIFSTLRLGKGKGLDGARGIIDGNAGQKLAWTAGTLFSLASIEECSIDARGGLWWAKVLIHRSEAG